MAGEEVVGGIVGFLRLDAAEFHREITRAIAEVKVLKGMDARVKVEATGARNVERDLLKVSRSAQGVERSVGDMSRSFRGMLSPQLIAGGLVAGMALVGPATAAASAAVGGFVGVVGTGVLAFQGLQREIEDGTAIGGALQSEIDGIGTALEGLSTTAGRAMSGGVIAGLTELREFLPTVNADVEELGGRLGDAFAVGTDGLISGLETAMPLLQDGGRYAQIMAEKFAAFTASRDFEDFVEYARSALPDVASNVGDLVVGLGKITIALAPVGDQLIALIGFFGQLAEAAAPVVGFFAQANKLTLAGVVNSLEDWVGLNDAAILAVDEHATRTADLTSAQSPLASSLGTTNGALSAARDKHAETARAAEEATLAMQLEGDAAGLLKQALDTLNGKALNVSSAQTSAASATLSLTSALEGNGTTLATNTEEGVRNRQAIERKILADQALATATAEATGSTEAGTESLKSSKDQIEDTLRSQGLLTDKVQGYIDKLYAVPKDVPPTKLEVETLPALERIAAFQKAIDNLRGRTVTAGVRYVYEGTKPSGSRSTAGGQTFADGGEIRSRMSRIPGYANGTIVGPGTGKSDSILAGIAGTGELIRVSNGEFISTDASRKRNRAALEAGNKGATLGVAGGVGAATSGQTTITETTHRPVYVTVQNLHANNVDDFTDRVESAAFAASVGRSL